MNLYIIVFLKTLMLIQYQKLLKKIKLLKKVIRVTRKCGLILSLPEERDVANVEMDIKEE